MERGAVPPGEASQASPRAAPEPRPGGTTAALRGASLDVARRQCLVPGSAGLELSHGEVGECRGGAPRGAPAGVIGR